MYSFALYVFPLLSVFDYLENYLEVKVIQQLPIKDVLIVVSKAVSGYQLYLYQF